MHIESLFIPVQDSLFWLAWAMCWPSYVSQSKDLLVGIFIDADMIKSQAHLSIPWMGYLALEREESALFHNSVIRV